MSATASALEKCLDSQTNGQSIFTADISSEIQPYDKLNVQCYHLKNCLVLYLMPDLYKQRTVVLLLIYY